MFTGIVTDLGRVRAVAPGGVARLTFETGYDTAEIAHGASIACNGVCLSVVDKGPGWFAAEASNETLACTTIRSEEHTSELQSLMRISYAVFCLKKKNNNTNTRPPINKNKTTNKKHTHTNQGQDYKHKTTNIQNKM